MNAQAIGTLVLAVPALLAAWLLLRRRRAILWFAVALIVVALGYLNATGATRDIGRGFLGASVAGTAPAR